MNSVIAQAFSDAVASDGLWLLLAAVFAAGLARGFAGFGTAMIYMPFAGTILTPVEALITVMVFDFFGPLPNVPRAIRESTFRDVLRLALGALAGLPLGLALIYRIDPVIFRWTVSITSLVLLVLLVSGWRYGGELSRNMVFGTGALGGFLGGASGLAGPPVILFYMASRKAVETIRANILLYLFFADLSILVISSISGIASGYAIMLGLVLTPAFLVANVIGGRLFNPKQEKIYRIFAYLLIAGAALINLPLFD